MNTVLNTGNPSSEVVLTVENRSVRAIIKRDSDGVLLFIEIDGTDYQSFDGISIALPISVIQTLHTSELPEDIGIEIYDEKGKAFSGTDGIYPNHVTLIGEKTAYVGCEVNLSKDRWEGVIAFHCYCNTVLHLLGFAKTDGGSSLLSISVDSSSINFGFAFTIEGSTIGEIVEKAKEQISVNLRPLTDVEEGTKRGLDNILSR